MTTTQQHSVKITADRPADPFTTYTATCACGWTAPTGGWNRVSQDAGYHRVAQARGAKREALR